MGKGVMVSGSAERQISDDVAQLQRSEKLVRRASAQRTAAPNRAAGRGSG